MTTTHIANRRAIGRLSGSLAALGLLLGLAGLALNGTHRGPLRRAIIVDQLSLTAPNPSFVAQASATLRRAGFEVGYVSGTDVTVRFFESLPARGDDLILLRVHAARIIAAGSKTDDVALFSGETMDPWRDVVSGIPEGPATAVALAREQSPAGQATPAGGTLSQEEKSRLIPVFYNPQDQEVPIFGLRPAFIDQDLKGRFKESSVMVMMGCDGLRSTGLADAFARRGVGTFIGWDDQVSGPHVDAATERLLELMLHDGVPIPEAVARTMVELGPDRQYKGRMLLATH